MKKFFDVAAFAWMTLSAAVLFAQPSIDANSVTMTHDAATGETLVTYKLTGTEPAIVTLDIETNAADWASIGPEALGFTGGDVNRLITEFGVTKTIHWRPGRTWPGAFSDKSQIRAVVKAWSTNSPPEWMVADLATPTNVFWFTSTNALPFGGITADIYKREYLVMRRIPANNVRWRMGARNDDEIGVYDTTSEKAHVITLSKDYYIGVYPFTRDQYEFLTDVVSATTSMKPMVNVSFDQIRGNDKGRGWPASADIDSDSLIAKIRDRIGISVDLPTTAQWEFACRAGTGTATYGGDLSDATTDENLKKIAWYSANAQSNLQPVGLLQPNAFGLYDMLGNVYEYCLDFADRSGTKDSLTDPKGPPTAQWTERVGSEDLGCRALRGGACNHTAQFCRAAFNYWGNASGSATRGIRLCWTLP